MKCKKLDSEIGKITYYTDSHDGYKGLLCSECIKIREKHYTEKCPKCKKIAYEHGGLTYYDDSDVDELNNFEGFDRIHSDEITPPSFEVMCMECHGKKVTRVKKFERSN